MREVAVQAANDTNNSQDRGNLQAEMDAMSKEIDRIAGTTTWAGANLMQDAAGTDFSFQVGTATGTQNQISVTIGAMNTAGLGLDGGTAGVGAVEEIAIGASNGNASATAFAVTAGSATQTGTITISNDNHDDIDVNITAGMTLSQIGSALADAYNVDASGNVTTAGNAASGYTAAFSSGTITFSDSTTPGSDTITMTVSNTLEPKDTLIAGSNVSVEASSTQTASKEALDSIVLIDAAIKQVNVQRSELGAVSNRLNHTVNNLTNISSNLSAAKGGIEDADFALETTNLAKNQILQQASTAMLAQANASKQNVLSLLQG